uniref:Solute carrier family 39 member 1 n=1 Tax=Pelusios castaneus TaxID=367368 RepID=A0A8C8RX41_9SAUR
MGLRAPLRDKAPYQDRPCTIRTCGHPEPRPSLIPNLPPAWPRCRGSARGAGGLAEPSHRGAWTGRTGTARIAQTSSPEPGPPTRPPQDEPAAASARRGLSSGLAWERPRPGAGQQRPRSAPDPPSKKRPPRGADPERNSGPSPRKPRPFSRIRPIRARGRNSLLAAKLGGLLGLLLLPLLCGLLPARLRGTGPRGRWRSFVGSVAGGIFLAACLLDILPATEASAPANAVSPPQVDFPFPEFVLTLGFLLVLIVEHVALDCRERRAGEATPLLSCEEAAPQPAGAGEWGVAAGTPHSHVDTRAHSSFRSCVLSLSLSVHSLFEGLAVGLQDTEARVLRICVAILVHKSILAVSLSLLLMQSRLPARCFVALMGTFALMSPLGIAVGIVLTQNPGPYSTMAQCLLQGMAAGTFVYITFLEILPQELNSSRGRLPKVLSMLLGFSVMAALRFLG